MTTSHQRKSPSLHPAYIFGTNLQFFVKISSFEADADEDPQSWVGSTQQVAAGSTAAGAQASGSPPELSNEERTCKLCGFIGASDSALLRHSVRHKRVTVKLFKL